MFKNYFKIAWRNLLRHKVFAAINIVGMTVAFTAAFLLGVAAWHEWSFDNFHVHRHEVYQVLKEVHMPGGRTDKSSSLPAPIVREAPHFQILSVHLSG